MELVKLISFSSRAEAGLAGGVLERHGIRHAIRGDDVGIFGPGHMGRSGIDIDLLVASEELERARQLLQDSGFPVDD